MKYTSATECNFDIIYYIIITFPTATAVVAISKKKESPLAAGAATAIGLVPRAACKNYLLANTAKCTIKSQRKLSYPLTL